MKELPQQLKTFIDINKGFFPKYVKITNTETEEVENYFIPVHRERTNEDGVYDVVQQEFYSISEMKETLEKNESTSPTYDDLSISGGYSYPILDNGEEVGKIYYHPEIPEHANIRIRGIDYKLLTQYNGFHIVDKDGKVTHDFYWIEDKLGEVLIYDRVKDNIISDNSGDKWTREKLDAMYNKHSAFYYVQSNGGKYTPVTYAFDTGIKLGEYNS